MELFVGAKIFLTLLLVHCLTKQLFSFQPELSKCSVDGIDVPVHKARAYVAMEIKVHLYDRDGEPCSGQHLVSLCCETDEQIFTEANSSTPGTYSLSYTPSCLGERSLVVAVNSTPINKTPFNVFFLNSPHPPNCTVILDKKIVQHKKFDALVKLKDQNGDQINSQQNVSAYFKFPDTFEKTEASISSSSDSPDKYTLVLTPPSSGEGVLSVFVDNQLIASPSVIITSKSSTYSTNLLLGMGGLGKKMVSNIPHAFSSKGPHHPFKMLLIGETGSGKTSFLNLLYNCGTVQALGCGFRAEGIEQFRQFNDIELENAMEHAMQSKTNDAKQYDVEVGDLKIGVIDSPGFGDSRGLKQDKENAKKIVNALKAEDYINCVCLIINGRQTRVSVSLKYVLLEITAILPRDILNNVIIVFSNTGDALDLSFDPNSLTEYFGKEVDNIICIENPYCQFEKAQSKVKPIGIKLVASSLQKSFEDTAKVLGGMCTTIKDFPPVHTNRFVELYYDKKQAIESTVLVTLAEYDNQICLEKEIRNKREEVSAAMGRKELNKKLRTTMRNEQWVTKPTDHYNTICGYTNCYSNCHVPCICSLPKVFGKEAFRFCSVMSNRLGIVATRLSPFAPDSTCTECGHSYIHHCYGKQLFEKRVSNEPVVDDAMEAKSKSDEERAKLLYEKFEKEKIASETKRKQLSDELIKATLEFETLGIARNYTKLIENQLALIDTHLETSTGPESEDLRKTRNEVKKMLEVQKAKEIK